MEFPRIIDKRAERIEGLRTFTDFAETHPDLPLGSSDPLRVSVYAGTDEENRAEIRRIAAVLGVDASQSSPGHYIAVRDFGGGTVYEAVAISHDRQNRWDRFMTGYGAAVVEPETAVAA
jgi:hypothetical protein